MQNYAVKCMHLHISVWKMVQADCILLLQPLLTISSSCTHSILQFQWVKMKYKCAWNWNFVEYFFHWIRECRQFSWQHLDLKTGLDNPIEKNTSWHWKPGAHLIFSIVNIPSKDQGFLLWKKKCFLSPALLFSLNATCWMIPVPVANFIQMNVKEKMGGVRRC